MKLRPLCTLAFVAFACSPGCAGGNEEPSPGLTPDSGLDTAKSDLGTDSGSVDSAPADTGSDGTGADAADSTPGDSTTDVADTAIDVVADVADAFEVGDAGDAGPPLPATEVWLVRVGTGSAALTADSTAAFVDRYRLSDASLLGTLTLPTAASGGNNALTLSGTATSEGALARSANGKYVTLAGYATGTGTASVKGTATTGTGAVLRVVARIASGGSIDTSTTTTSHSGDNVRAAVSSDGTAHWIAGAKDGIVRIAHAGSGAATTISTGITNARTSAIFGGALHGTTGAGSFRLFDFGGTLPTSAATPSTLPGTATTGLSPYALQGLALGSSPAIDTIYVCDDRATPDGGVQRYKLAGGSWSLGTTLNAGLTAGCRGLAAFVSGSSVLLVVSTAEVPQRLVVFVDTLTGLTTASPVAIATAATNTAYRGVALAPTP